MTTATRTPPHHDNTTCYTAYNCRLPKCVARMRAYEQRRREAQAAGTWQPFVDAAPVRQHLIRLDAAGINAFRVGILTGLPDRTIRGFVSRQHNGLRRLGLRQRTTPEIAAKILAIDPKTAAAAKVNSIGSRRRLQALTATGWPTRHIERNTGISTSTMTGVFRQPLILASTAHAIDDGYQQLRNLNPRRRKVDPLQIRKARNRAAANNWPNPTYWDDPEHPIDDPDFVPMTAKQVIAEEARFFMDMEGLTIAQVAERLSRSIAYVRDCLDEHPEQDAA